ncbi:hypothetical protein SLEP1_g18167 [Rubroshorea leprosula]|uniref:Uncharacterized protein n=1 Tax=Rubroshorea leprosula TaxID=152421 RepID=A0AAV5J786_9ROSI|nr:hypothetical protein SLEP1_g18167 [Rubroshorea leprosula]
MDCTSISFSGHPFRRKTRGETVVTSAGPSTSSYVFAFALPLSLLAATIFTAIRVADKLESDYLEELAINQAIEEAQEEDDDDEREDDDNSLEEEEEKPEPEPEPEPALPRTRNRPKREA